jgi:hypothetical protein
MERLDLGIAALDPSLARFLKPLGNGVSGEAKRALGGALFDPLCRIVRSL